MFDSCPESTIESADSRRNFIKKAVALTAVAGVGGVLLDKPFSIIPESSAASLKKVNVTTDTTKCNSLGNIAVFDCKSDITGAYRTSPANLSGNTCFGTGLLNVNNICGCGIISTGNSCGGAGVVGYGCWGIVGIAGCHTGAWGRSCNGYGVQGCSNGYPGVIGYSNYCVGVCGNTRNCMPGVRGQSTAGPGIMGLSCSSVVGSLKNNGQGSNKSALIQFENGCSTPSDWYAGVSGAGNSHCLPPGEFFIVGQSAPRVVVNSSGNVGLGTISPVTTLQVNGSISAKTRIISSSYSMSAADFAILGDASPGTIILTLPSASNAGMIVLVKKIDSSSHSVKVQRAGTDTIEGRTSQMLSAEYDSLTLIAGGNGVWYVLSNAT